MSDLQPLVSDIMQLGKRLSRLEIQEYDDRFSYHYIPEDMHVIIIAYRQMVVADTLTIESGGELTIELNGEVAII